MNVFGEGGQEVPCRHGLSLGRWSLVDGRVDEKATRHAGLWCRRVLVSASLVLFILLGRDGGAARETATDGVRACLDFPFNDFCSAAF